LYEVLLGKWDGMTCTRVRKINRTGKVRTT